MTVKYKFVNGEEVYVEVYGRFESIISKVNRVFESKSDCNKAKQYISLSENFAENNSNPEIQMLERFDKQTLYRAILSLEPDDQELINNLYLLDKPATQRQYANILGITEKDVELRLRKAKEKLKYIMLMIQ